MDIVTAMLETSQVAIFVVYMPNIKLQNCLMLLVIELSYHEMAKMSFQKPRWLLVDHFESELHEMVDSRAFNRKFQNP